VREKAIHFRRPNKHIACGLIIGKLRSTSEPNSVTCKRCFAILTDEGVFGRPEDGVKEIMRQTDFPDGIRKEPVFPDEEVVEVKQRAAVADGTFNATVWLLARRHGVPREKMLRALLPMRANVRMIRSAESEELALLYFAELLEKAIDVSIEQCRKAWIEHVSVKDFLG
jgi:hypothetical protein